MRHQRRHVAGAPLCRSYSAHVPPPTSITPCGLKGRVAHTFALTASTFATSAPTSANPPPCGRPHPDNNTAAFSQPPPTKLAEPPQQTNPRNTEACRLLQPPLPPPASRPSGPSQIISKTRCPTAPPPRSWPRPPARLWSRPRPARPPATRLRQRPEIVRSAHRGKPRSRIARPPSQEGGRREKVCPLVRRWQRGATARPGGGGAVDRSVWELRLWRGEGEREGNRF